ncbi:MAG: histidinol-phosphate aminotransferase 2 [Lysobacteraceae bacterium]|nr:MAG: histidinol-phosphate aminotransferase 2 [Xanthomonadaceae bacterium]
MSNRFLDLAAKGLHPLKPYAPGKPISELEREYGVSDIIKLASNENPLGPSPKAVAAMQKEMLELALYPDGNGFDLKSTLAEHLGVSVPQITLGNGSNDVLVLLAEAFLTPEHNAVYSQYAFAVYPLAIQAVGAGHKVAAARPADDAMPLGHDLNALADQINDKTRLIFIANPNNPTGTWLDMAELKAFVANAPDHALVIIDEAYYEYSGDQGAPTAIDWLDDFPNLVVTRTFSKAFGLAGLRVGYSVSHPDVADLLNRIRQPFNVNNLALVGAAAAMGDEDFLQASRALNSAGLVQLSNGLAELGLEVIPSQGNFLLVDMAQDAMPLYEALLHGGVIVRPVGPYGLPNHLRISIGTEAQNARVLQTLAKTLDR